MTTYWIWMRLAIAGVWLYQGLWHKVIAVDPRHAQILAQAMGSTIGPLLLTALGLMETAFAICVLIGWKRRLAAIAQVLSLVAMNAGGLLAARDQIPDPLGMLTLNLVFALAILGQAWARDERP